MTAGYVGSGLPRLGGIKLLANAWEGFNVNILSFGSQPQQLPHWENKHIALCQEREALASRIQALIARRNLLDAQIYALFQFQEKV
jgi:hypothetical protein